MDVRQQRGQEIAERANIVKMGAAWLVPSQSDNGTYRVTMEADAIRCTCPDFDLRQQPCKHIFAAAIIAQRTTVTERREPDGSTTKTTVTETAVRLTYPQPNWSAYNRAQCVEKETAQALLRSLCDGIVNLVQSGRGRPRTPLSETVFAMTMKVFGGMSARRSTTDIEASMDHAPKYNTILEQFDRPELTPLLTTLIEEAAAPLSVVESQFAVDATGFGTVTYKRWFDAKYGREMKAARWIKAHAMIGTTTNVITSIRVTESNVNDGPELPALLASTTERFKVSEVSADKAYLTTRNVNHIEAAGAVPYIPFKSNSQGDGSEAWRRMYGLFLYKQPEFLAHYHKRSNAESTFSAMKRKFGPSVRSKNPTAQVNEVLCKALCFNLSTLVHAMHELGIDPTFGRAA